MAISVVVAVGAPTADALIEQFRQRVGALKVGAPDAAGTYMGPLVNAQWVAATVCGYIEAGVPGQPGY